MSLSPDLVQLLRGLMDPDPESRLTVVAALQSPWLLPTASQRAEPRADIRLMQHMQQLSGKRSFTPCQVSLLVFPLLIWSISCLLAPLFGCHMLSGHCNFHHWGSDMFSMLSDDVTCDFVQVLVHEAEPVTCSFYVISGIVVMHSSDSSSIKVSQPCACMKLCDELK